MPVKNRIAALHDEITAWRHDVHRHPEILPQDDFNDDAIPAGAGWFVAPTKRRLPLSA